MSEIETAECSVCQTTFERSTEPKQQYISCPAHSFGETVEMQGVVRLDGESRKDYLFRVALAYLQKMEKEDEGSLALTIVYDGTDCDGACLIEDMNNEFL